MKHSNEEKWLSYGVCIILITNLSTISNYHLNQINRKKGMLSLFHRGKFFKTEFLPRVFLSNFCMALFQMCLITVMITSAEQAKPIKYLFTNFTQGQSFNLHFTNINSRGLLQEKSCFFLW